MAAEFIAAASILVVGALLCVKTLQWRRERLKAWQRASEVAKETGMTLRRRVRGGYGTPELQGNAAGRPFRVGYDAGHHGIPTGTTFRMGHRLPVKRGAWILPGATIDMAIKAPRVVAAPLPGARAGEDFRLVTVRPEDREALIGTATVDTPHSLLSLANIDGLASAALVRSGFLLRLEGLRMTPTDLIAVPKLMGEILDASEAGWSGEPLLAAPHLRAPPAAAAAIEWATKGMAVFLMGLSIAVIVRGLDPADLGSTAFVVTLGLGLYLSGSSLLLLMVLSPKERQLLRESNAHGGKPGV